MRRNLAILFAMVFNMGLVVAGRVWMPSVRERTWFNDPQNITRDVNFFVILPTIVICASVLIGALNRRRYPDGRLAARERSSLRPHGADHPLRGRQLNG